MGTVTVLTAARINHRRVHRWLVNAGYAVDVVPDGVRIARHGRWDAVDTTPAKVHDLHAVIIDPAKALLGFAPREGITCSFEGSAHESDAWTTVLDIARAVAANAPLAVLDDHAGTTYLVHPGRGLVGPEEYEPERRRPSTGELLRRFLGDRI